MIISGVDASAPRGGGGCGGGQRRPRRRVRARRRRRQTASFRIRDGGNTHTETEIGYCSDLLHDCMDCKMPPLVDIFKSSAVELIWIFT